MSIRRDIQVDADIQSFAVSNGSIVVPYVWEDLPIQTWKANSKNSGNLDTANNIIMCLPKPQYDLLRTRGLLGSGSNNTSSNSKKTPEQISGDVFKSFVINKYLLAVEIKDKGPWQPSKGNFKDGEYYIRIISDRQSPFLGEIITASISALRRHNYIPVPFGQSANQNPVDPELKEQTSSSQVRDLRNDFLQDLNNAIEQDNNLNTSGGPYYRDPNRELSFSNGNRLIVDHDKGTVSVYTDITQDPKIYYDGPAERYSNESLLRTYGGPEANYKKDNLSENPMQQVVHSTFMTPVRTYLSSPIINMDPKVTQIISEFGPILGM